MVHAGSSEPFRPIRPRTSIPDSPASGPSSGQGKLKRASIACNECKRHRVRCSNGIPCAECNTHDRECTYNERADKRRKIAAKHTEDELNYYRRFLDQLLQAIRLGERADVDDMVTAIRGGATEDEILTAASCCLDQRQSPPNLDLPSELALSGMGLDTDEGVRSGWGNWPI